jgi:hypothetical protein
VIKASNGWNGSTARPATTAITTFAIRRFNPAARAQASGAPAAREALVASYGPNLAAMLIFLNRTGFNGLFRLNPPGRLQRAAPAGMPSPASAIRITCGAWPTAFGQAGLTLELAGFETTIGEAGPGDFIYCDPPYAPSAAPPASPTTPPTASGAADQDGWQHR